MKKRGHLKRHMYNPINTKSSKSIFENPMKQYEAKMKRHRRIKQ
jgi:hypothetical protein